MKKYILLIFLLFTGNRFIAAQPSGNSVLFTLEPDIHFGRIVKNSPSAPNSTSTVLSSINFMMQTNGTKDWHHYYNFPKTGLLFLFGGLGNRRELGNIYGFVPNMTLNSVNRKWYSPRLSLGLGMAFFNNPYNAQTNTTNLYIGSSFTALGYATIYVQPKISKDLEMKAGASVFHASNGHIQIPNLGINLPALFVGIIYKPRVFPDNFERKTISMPKSGVRLNIRAGIGVHQLARTTEPIGTAKYAVYVTDLYLSRQFGRISNVHAGLEISYYNSYYNYIADNNFFSDNQKLKSTVATVFLGHEFLIGHVSLLSQGGINIYNPFYNAHIKLFKSEGGFSTELKKYISTRLGLQYYLLDPKRCTGTNFFIGAYIKANFGQADFICSQAGFVF